MDKREAQPRAGAPALDTIDRMIRRGAGYSGVRHFFLHDADAFDYFGATQAAFHPPDGPAVACCLCRGRRSVRMARLAWRADFAKNVSAGRGLLMALSHLAHVPVEMEDSHRFATHHPFCGDCWRAWRRRFVCLTLLVFVGWAKCLFGGMVAAFCLVLGYGGDMKPRDHAAFLLTGWVALPVCLFGALAAAWASRAKSPAPVRHIGCGRVRLESAALV